MKIIFTCKNCNADIAEADVPDFDYNEYDEFVHARKYERCADIGMYCKGCFRKKYSELEKENFNIKRLFARAMKLIKKGKKI